MTEEAELPAPLRQVVCADALVWLRENEARPTDSIVTSLPDVSELPLALPKWKLWFMEAARSVLSWVPEDGVALFFQSDIRVDGVWIDKAFLVQSAAFGTGHELLFHKVVCRRPPGTPSLGRASYSHLLCFSRRPLRMCHATPDVLPEAGLMPWSRAMGTTAGELACRFLAEETATRRVVDPFCGQGTILAVANRFGFEALGVDLSPKRCRKARTLRLD